MESATESKKYAEIEMEKKSEVEQCEQKQPPTIVREPKVHNDGKHIYLDFIATSRLAPTFAWKKGVGGGAKKIIASSDRIKILREFVSKKVYHFSLEIINPTIGDFGQYICTVRNKSGKLYATFNVEVPKKNFPSTEKPQIREDGKAPHFPRQPVTREYYDGSLALECFVDANPTPQVKWYYDNKEVENSARFRAYLSTTASDSYWAMLTIKKLVDADAGAYSCVIVNQHGKGIANFTVELTGFSSPTFVEKPQISSRDDGQVMVMEFRAKSILEPTFVWQKLVGGGAKEIISNSDRIKAVEKIEARNVYYSALKIKEPTKDKDAGQFICTVKNESGELTATFTVKFEVPEGAPSFTRKPQILQQTSSGGEPAICFDIGYSARMNPQVTWISPKSKKMKESSRIKFKTNDEGNGNFTAQLELTNYEAKNSGTYTCNIKNDAGEANVELTLNIEGPLDDYADDSEN